MPTDLLECTALLVVLPGQDSQLFLMPGFRHVLNWGLLTWVNYRSRRTGYKYKMNLSNLGEPACLCSSCLWPSALSETKRAGGQK